ncbi:CWF19-like protein 1 isoform X2 [Gigantopelta aegis]|uniref:CWF19-like protein 1 isoform X2 n=1 Tax=Gigantopelta aegis TaxID=1735272 RepID=UPI001B88C549|nr:CWF19-like protein 1 isoform X2 [Gigantopelta aegis]
MERQSLKILLLLCVGDFFGTNDEEWEDIVSGSIKVPISTLILGPNKPEHTKYFSGKDGTELCENITYLGSRGMFTGSSGLQIAYLSGVESSGSTCGPTEFDLEAVTSLTVPVAGDSKFKGVDILLTSQWPVGVEKYADDIQGADNSATRSAAVAEIARVLRPRYHFCGLDGIHYERHPYRNHQVLSESARHVSRFISLSKVGNSQKKKFLYAFSITPLSKMDSVELIKQPQDVTECPYKPSSNLAYTSNSKEEQSTQFFYDMTVKKDNSGQKRKSGSGDYSGERKRKPPQPTGPCWFCLGSPQVEKHLVVSVGTEIYIALAKGGLVPDHVLILPIGHHQSIVSAPTDIQEEIIKYQSSLKKFFKAQGKGVVFFERNFRTQHLQIQVVPIPEDTIIDAKDVFMDCAEGSSIELYEIPKHSDLKQIVPVGAPYFYAEMPTGEKLLHRISKSFPLQFGREALSQPGLLNMPERVDWKNCVLSKDEESEIAASFKTDFRQYDFNFT